MSSREGTRGLSRYQAGDDYNDDNDNDHKDDDNDDNDDHGNDDDDDIDHKDDDNNDNDDHGNDNHSDEDEHLDVVTKSCKKRFSTHWSNLQSTSVKFCWEHFIAFDNMYFI